MLGSPPTDDSSRRRRSPFAPGPKAAPPAAAARTREGREREALRPRQPRRLRPPDQTRGLVVPVRRLVAFAVGGFAALLTVGLIMGSQTSGVAQRLPFAVVVLGAQVLYVFASTMALRPPGAKTLGVVGILAAGAANYVASIDVKASIVPLGYVAAGGFLLGSLGQLTLRSGRMRLTESFGSALVIVLGVVSYSTLLVLVRIPLGTQTIAVCLLACGVALSIARLTDVIMPYPRLADQVPRGAVGVVVGTMVGTAAAGYLGRYLVLFTPGTAAMVGAIAAAAAVLADLTIGFAEAGRELEGDAPTMWLARHMQGPLAGFALSAPVAYAINSYLWTAS